jgi:hypothetical protein
MRADFNQWVQATENLKARRKKNAGTVSDIPTYQNPVSDYKLHLIKCGYGSSLIDCGCGAQFLKSQISPRTHYIGVDAFPADGYEETTLPIAVESEEFLELKADTVCAIAVLDNCLDLDKFIHNMKCVAQKNIIILTGIGIEVDPLHTFKIEMIDIDSRFTDWKCTHREMISPKVWLLSYER